MTFEERKKLLNECFQEFRRSNVSARYMACGGWKLLGASDDTVAYDKHDLKQLKEVGNMFLTFSGNSEKILEILRKYFEKVRWDGFEGSRIKICFNH